MPPSDTDPVNSPTKSTSNSSKSAPSKSAPSKSASGVSSGPEKSAADTLSFEKAMQRIQQAVDELEGGELELAAALKVYEQAVHMIRRCHQLLGDAQQQVELLTGIAEDGTVQTEPFDEETDESLTEKQESRSRRRSRTQSDSNPGNRLF